MKQINIPHFTLEHLQVKPITIQMARKRSSIPKITFSGLIDQHIKESMVRLTVVMQHLGFYFPKDVITIHFTPAIYEKRGADYDLALAVGLLTLFDQIPNIPPNLLFLSELGLNGTLTGSDAFLAYYHHLIHHKKDWTMITAPEVKHWLQSHQAPDHAIQTVPSLTALMTLLQSPDTFHARSSINAQQPCNRPPTSRTHPSPLKEAQGLTLSKTALHASLIAQTPLMFIGPPGVGKTLLMNLAQHLLPHLSFEAWLEGHRHLNIRDKHDINLAPPFRAPHYNASLESFVGTYHKGRWIPGEFSLANGGILFLDELPHFKPQVLEALRTPLQDQVFLLSRAHLHLKLPAKFTMFAAMNPCPCGYYFFNPCQCSCTQRQIVTYLSRLSGPIRERFGITHLISPHEEQNPTRYPSDVDAEDIRKLREQFDQQYDHPALFERYQRSKSPEEKSRTVHLNKRKEKLLTKVAFALALLRQVAEPDETDWTLARKLQNANMFFTQGGF